MGAADVRQRKRALAKLAALDADTYLAPASIPAARRAESTCL